MVLVFCGGDESSCFCSHFSLSVRLFRIIVFQVLLCENNATLSFRASEASHFPNTRAKNSSTPSPPFRWCGFLRDCRARSIITALNKRSPLLGRPHGAPLAFWFIREEGKMRECRCRRRLQERNNKEHTVVRERVCRHFARRSSISGAAWCHFEGFKL